MKFDIIEGLSEEDILQIYENELVISSEEYIGFCVCYDYSIRHLVNFGASHPPNAVPPIFTGYCSEQLNDFSACQLLCENQGYPLFHFDAWCVCGYDNSYSAWYWCKR